MSQYQDAIRDLYFAQYEMKGTNFRTQLLDLIAKADKFNRAKIRIGFPEEVQAWEDWHNSDDPEEFFKSKGFSRES